MQAKWLLSSLLFGLLPSYLFPQERRTSHDFLTSKNSLRSSPSLDQAMKGLSKFTSHSLGTTLNAAVHAAFCALPFFAAGKEVGVTQRFPNKLVPGRIICDNNMSHCLLDPLSVLDGYGGFGGDNVALKCFIYIQIFYAFAGGIVHTAVHSFYPATILASNAVITSLISKQSSKWVSKLPDLVDGEIGNEANVFPDKGDDEIYHEDALVQLKHDGNASMIVEPKTGAKFPSVLSTGVRDDAVGLQVLVGVGVKNVMLMKLKSINIYAFGLYLKSDELRQRLGDKYNVYSPEELKSKSSFYEDLLRQNVDMTVRLIVHYKGLKMGMVRSAFDTSLRNRLKKMKGVEEDESLSIFSSYFSEDLVLLRGSIIDFQWVAGSQFRTEIDGKLIGIITSRDFCRAFFDIYIGDPPVSLKTKEDIGERLGYLLRG